MNIFIFALIISQMPYAVHCDCEWECERNWRSTELTIHANKTQKLRIYFFCRPKNIPFILDLRRNSAHCSIPDHSGLTHQKVHEAGKMLELTGCSQTGINDENIYYKTSYYFIFFISLVYLLFFAPETVVADAKYFAA